MFLTESFLGFGKGGWLYLFLVQDVFSGGGISTGGSLCPPQLKMQTVKPAPHACTYTAAMLSLKKPFPREKS